MLRRAGSCTAVLTALCLLAPNALADTISATDGASSVQITTPIARPGPATCTRVPFTYAVAADVTAATAVIVDTYDRLVARSAELLPGTGTDELNLCSANLSRAGGPYLLQLRITHSELSAKDETRLGSAPFGFAVRTVSCRKKAAPRRGSVQRFTTARCPSGWAPDRTH